MSDVWRRFLAALTHSGPGYDRGPLPRRGDAVERWLTERRDGWAESDVEWHVLDDALRLYRGHADTRTPLGFGAQGGAS